MSPYGRKLKPLTQDFTVVMDDREVGDGKRPWLWLDGPFNFEVHRLKTGDYTIKGYEDKVALECKHGIDEVLTWLTVPRTQAIECMERMSAYQVKAIVVEEQLTMLRVTDWIKTIKKSSRGKSRLKPETIWHWTAKIMTMYGVPIIYCDRRCVEPIVVNWLQMAYQQVRR